MPAYVIVQIGEIKDPSVYERYKELAPASIAVYGGRYIVRGGPSEALEGSWPPMRRVILEFPDSERARAWWSSPEYAEARALRQSCSTADMLLIEGVSSQP